MFDYEYYFAMTLQDKLKQKIKGNIFVSVTANDSIYIHIVNKTHNVSYEQYYSGFSDKLLNGLTTSYAAYEIAKEYREFLNGRFFV